MPSDKEIISGLIDCGVITKPITSSSLISDMNKLTEQVKMLERTIKHLTDVYASPNEILRRRCEYLDEVSKSDTKEGL